jgi:hypothetical protein
MSRTAWSTGIVALAAVMLALTGCAAGSSSDEYVSPSHAPAAPPAPQNEKEAVKGAAAAVQRSMDADMAVNVAGDGDTSSLKKVRTGESLKNSIAGVEHYAARKYKVSGKVTFELKEGNAESSDWQGILTPFGEAHVTGCINYTDFVIKDAQGAPVPFDGPRRSLTQQNVLWDLVSKSWVVSSGALLGKAC